MNKSKQKRNMQKMLLNILVESKKNNIPYLSREELVSKINNIYPNIVNVESKISQALYLLRIKKIKWSQPQVIKVDKGWTIKDVEI